MRKFEYASPTAINQVPELLQANWGPAEILAGGTDLLALMKDDVLQPKRLVNIKQIAEMRGVVGASSGIRIGALSRLQDLADNIHVQRSFPALAQACADAASPQIRNLATLGGNLCQRPRCWYFRNGMGLLAQGADGKSLVPDGDNRYHAILGNQGPAYFVSPSSIAPVLVAYNAELRIVGPKGARRVTVEKFFRIPQAEDEREHDLAPNEIVTEIVLPPAPAPAKAAIYEVRQKYSFDWPLATAAAALHMSGNTVLSARIVLGHVAPVPWVSPEAAQALQGKTITRQLAEQAGRAAVRDARPLSHNAYKVQLARVAVQRAILAAAGMAPVPAGSAA
jgi:xanthine dehydrogenase YagS FAD-binding subunit